MPAALHDALDELAEAAQRSETPEPGQHLRPAKPHRVERLQRQPSEERDACQREEHLVPGLLMEVRETSSRRVTSLTQALLPRTSRSPSLAFQRQLGKITPYLFPHLGGPHKGEPRLGFRKLWRTACKLAGVPGRIPHDFRRTAVRNLERRGIARSVAMKITGHKTKASTGGTRSSVMPTFKRLPAASRARFRARSSVPTLRPARNYATMRT